MSPFLTASFSSFISCPYQEDDDNIIFSNVITSADPDEIISRVHDVEIAFSCVYPKRANLTLGFTHKNPYAFRERGFGAFTFQFEFFETQLFRKQVIESNYPVEVYLKQMIFMQIEETSSIPNTELFVESCKATPYDNPNSRISYTIIDNGYLEKMPLCCNWLRWRNYLFLKHLNCFFFYLSIILQVCEGQNSANLPQLQVSVQVWNGGF